MSVCNLEAARVHRADGATGRTHRAGHCANLLRSGFSGPIMPVNPKYEPLAALAYRDIQSLPVTPRSGRHRTRRLMYSA